MPSLTNVQFKALLAIVFGVVATTVAAAPVPPDWKPVALAASGLLTALAALIDPNRVQPEG